MEFFTKQNSDRRKIMKFHLALKEDIEDCLGEDVTNEIYSLDNPLTQEQVNYKK